MNEKTCPRCQQKHFKPGMFCSRACANSRQWTNEHKKVFSERQREYMARDTDEVELHKWKLAHNAAFVGALKLNRVNEEEDTREDYFLLPELNDIDDASEFIQDGAIWSVDKDY